MELTSLAKATIVDLEGGSDRVQVHFNPKEYSLNKTNSWTPQANSGSNVPQAEFGGGQPETLQMQLFFDTYTDGERSHDVRTVYTNKIHHLMLVNDRLTDPTTRRARPPKVRFQWGTAWSFTAVITTITQRFTLFLSDGKPVRAVLDVTFQQIEDASRRPATNPTSRGAGGERVWIVKQDDTLAWIAYEMYRDPRRWRVIADANQLTQVRRLTPGTILAIPNA